MKEGNQGERIRDNVYKGKKGFGYGVKGGKAGPGNTAIRDLLADERFTEAVVGFLGLPKQGKSKMEWSGEMWWQVAVGAEYG